MTLNTTILMLSGQLDYGFGEPFSVFSPRFNSRLCDGFARVIFISRR